MAAESTLFCSQSHSRTATRDREDIYTFSWGDRQDKGSISVSSRPFPAPQTPRGLISRICANKNQK